MDSKGKSKTRLNKTDLRAIDMRTEAEVGARLGPAPTRESLGADGHNTLLSFALDLISGVGHVLTLLTVEVIQALTALVLLFAFGLLEAERLYSGALVLQQADNQAKIIAGAFVAANVLLPIYALRAVRGQESILRTRHTLRGWLMVFWRRLTARPQTYKASPDDNPTLRIAESAVTWATLTLAMLAVLGPTLARYADERWYTALLLAFTGSNFSEFLESLGGLLISVGGVFMLQSIAFEAAVRAHFERPVSVNALLEARRREYQEAIAEIRRKVTAEHIAGKLADDARKKAEKEREAEAESGGNGARPFEHAHP